MRGAARQSQYRGSCGKLGEWREGLAGSLANRERTHPTQIETISGGCLGLHKPPRPTRLTLRLGGRGGLRVAEPGDRSLFHSTLVYLTRVSTSHWQYEIHEVSFLASGY